MSVNMMISESTVMPKLTDLGLVKTSLPLVFGSIGVKGLEKMPKADLYLDCRGIANPSHGGPSGTGDEVDVQYWVATHSNIKPYCEMVEMALSRMTARRGAGKEFEKPFKILCMCAHGVHRSKSMKHLLARWAKLSGYMSVEVE